MHTVRNRLASRPLAGVPVARRAKLPDHAAVRGDRVPVQRGSMAIALAIPDESGLVESRAANRRNPKGKKARKAAARLAAAREVQVLPVVPMVAEAPAVETPKPKRRGKAGAKTLKASSKLKSRAVQPEQLPAIPAAPMLEQRLLAGPAPVLALPLPLSLPLPSKPEPLSEQLVVSQDEPKVPRVLSFSAMPELKEPVIALKAFLPSGAPGPLVEAPVVPEAEPVPGPEPATADYPAPPSGYPLPRAQALVPARRQGLIDVIAFLLRDSGRRLARWSARRHRSRAEQAVLRMAEARQLNLQRELEALEALRRKRG